MRVVLLAVAVLAAGCIKSSGFECSSNSVCTHAGVQGTCESVGFCSFPDTSCSTGKRFADLSGSYANQCVGTGGLDGGIDAVDGNQLPDGLGCPVGYATLSGISNRAYRRLPAAQWTTQRDACHADGANVYLAIPDSAIELQAIFTLAGGTTWIGIDDLVTENTFLTVLGAPATYLPWASGQPDDSQNSDCVEALTAQTFDDKKCSTSVIAVCECEP